MKQEKDRTKEIEKFFRTMQEKTEKYQKYFAALATSTPTAPEKKTIRAIRGFICPPWRT